MRRALCCFRNMFQLFGWGQEGRGWGGGDSTIGGNCAGNLRLKKLSELRCRLLSGRHLGGYGGVIEIFTRHVTVDSYTFSTARSEERYSPAGTFPVQNIRFYRPIVERRTFSALDLISGYTRAEYICELTFVNSVDSVKSNTLH